MSEFDGNLPKFIFRFFKECGFQLFVLAVSLILAYFLISFLGPDNPIEESIEKVVKEKTGLEIDVSQ